METSDGESLKTISPPVAEQREHTVQVHDKSWNDPYFWLRNKEDENVIQYLEQENTYTEHVMKPTEELQETLFNELKGRIKETDQSVPTKEGEYFYYTRTVEGKSYSIYCRKFQTMESEEQILLDVNKLAEGKEYCRLGSFKISPNHKLMAYSVDFSGYEIYTVYIQDLISGDTFDYTIGQSGGLIEWIDNDSIFYNTVDDIKRSYRIFHHTLHQPDQDSLVYEEPNEEFFLYAVKSTDKKFVFMYSHGRESDVIRYIDLKDPKTYHQFNEQKDQVEYSFDHHSSHFYFLTSKDAVNFRFCRTEVGKHDEANWFELVSHSEDRLLNDIEMFKDFGVLSYRENGYPGLRIFTLPDFEDHSIEMPEQIYAAYPNKNPNYDTDNYRFYYSSLITPPTIYEYHIKDKHLVMRKQDEIKDFEPSKYTTRRELVVVRDGTKVPISISYKKGITKPAPLLLYGYGSYGISIDATFNSDRISLLDRGIIYVIAHIRGGGEMGKKWYHNGKLQQKKNTFFDFVDVAKYLTSTGYTSKDKLAIYGGSAGGLLVGATVNLQPDLFKSAIARVPFVDVINTMLDTSIPLTTFEFLEWGNPAESTESFDYMWSYSPYDQIGSVSTNYPNMLLLGGLNDPRVHYWEPAKFTAKMRTVKTDDNMLILKTNMGAGHGGSSGRYDSMKETAFLYSYVILSLELPLE